MKRIVLTHGLLAGAIVSVLMAVTVPLGFDGTLDLATAQLLGYASMVLAFVVVFFGVLRYREEIGGGSVTFGRAFGVGLLITLVCCALYVATWQVLYWGFLPDFGERYTEQVLDEMRREGAPAAEIEAEARRMADFEKLYRNPVVNVAITFLEIFPVGLVMTLVAAAILRRRADSKTAAEASPA